MVNIIVTETIGVLICECDLYLHLNPKMDTSHTKTTSEPVCKKIKTLFKEIDLIEVWRELYSDRKDYLHYSAQQNV